MHQMRHQQAWHCQERLQLPSPPPAASCKSVIASGRGKRALSLNSAGHGLQPFCLLPRGKIILTPELAATTEQSKPRRSSRNPHEAGDTVGEGNSPGHCPCYASFIQTGSHSGTSQKPLCSLECGTSTAKALGARDHVPARHEHVLTLKRRLTV